MTCFYIQSILIDPLRHKVLIALFANEVVTELKSSLERHSQTKSGIARYVSPWKWASFNLGATFIPLFESSSKTIAQ